MAAIMGSYVVVNAGGTLGAQFLGNMAAAVYVVTLLSAS
jgi:hypothetical protein